MEITEKKHQVISDEIYRVFTVQRPGHASHYVHVRISPDGTPQGEECDCPGFKYRRTCSHISEIYDSGILNHYVD